MVGSSCCRDDEIDGVTFVTGPRSNHQTGPEDPNDHNGNVDASVTVATAVNTNQDPATSGTCSGLVDSNGPLVHDDTEARGMTSAPSVTASIATNRSSSDSNATVTITAPSQPTPTNATASTNTDVGNLFDASVMSSPPSKQRTCTFCVCV